MRSRGIVPYPRGAFLLLTGAILWSLAAPSIPAFVTAGVIACALIAGSTIPCSGILVGITRRRPEGEKTVVLTFDDGPDPVLTPATLDLLREERTPATFFLVGEKVRAHPDLVRRIVAEGHRVANHSWDHRPWHNFRGGAALRANLARASAMIEEACGIRPEAYRPPYGLVNPWTRAAVEALGLHVVGWSVRGLDCGNRRVRGLAGRILARVSPGDFVLLHDSLPPGVSAETVLQELRALLDGLRELDLLPTLGRNQSESTRQKS